MKLGLVRGAVFIGAVLGVSTALCGCRATPAHGGGPSRRCHLQRAATAKAEALNDVHRLYGVTVNNTSGNTINNVVFEGNLVSSISRKQAELAPTLTDGATCAGRVPADPSLYRKRGSRSVRHRPSQGPDSTTSAIFTLFFKAPIRTRVTPLPLGDYAGFSGQHRDCRRRERGQFSERLGGPVAARHDRFVPGGSDAPVGRRILREDPLAHQRVTVKSAVPKAGGSFFTGDRRHDGLLGGDPFTTTVIGPDLRVHRPGDDRGNPAHLHQRKFS